MAGTGAGLECASARCGQTASCLRSVRALALGLASRQYTGSDQRKSNQLVAGLQAAMRIHANGHADFAKPLQAPRFRGAFRLAESVAKRGAEPHPAWTSYCCAAKAFHSAIRVLRLNLNYMLALGAKWARLSCHRGARRDRAGDCDWPNPPGSLQSAWYLQPPPQQVRNAYPLQSARRAQRFAAFTGASGKLRAHPAAGCQTSLGMPKTDQRQAS
jgi:hypothetical protein